MYLMHVIILKAPGVSKILNEGRIVDSLVTELEGIDKAMESTLYWEL